MSPRWFTVLWLIGCNQIYSLDSTHLDDARPTGCPAIGTAPTFGIGPTTIIFDRLISYYQLDEARQRAIAVERNTVLQGNVDAAILGTAFEDADPNHEVGVVRLLPEGDAVLVQVRDKTTNAVTVVRYERGGDTWTEAATEQITLADEFDRLSAPTRKGPARRILQLTRESAMGFAKVIEELEEDDAGKWSPVGAPYRPFDLGVDAVFDPNLTPDGLRMVFSGFGFSGENAIYYADRPSIDARFGGTTIALTLIGNGQTLSPFLAPDCSRIYFYAVPGIHYVER
jgi:hypothetical protein